VESGKGKGEDEESKGGNRGTSATSNFLGPVSGARSGRSQSGNGAVIGLNLPGVYCDSLDTLQYSVD